MIINLAVKFHSIEAFNTLTHDDINLTTYLNISNKNAVWAHICSFKYVQVIEKPDNIKSCILQPNIGYEHLKELCIRLWRLPVSTATAERSFSAMNRICTRLQNRIGKEALNACMKICIEGPEEHPPVSLRK